MITNSPKLSPFDPPKNRSIEKLLCLAGEHSNETESIQQRTEPRYFAPAQSRYAYGRSVPSARHCRRHLLPVTAEGRGRGCGGNWASGQDGGGNGRVKKMGAQQAPDISILKDGLTKDFRGPRHAERRYSMSRRHIRRPGVTPGVNRSTVRRPPPPAKDVDLLRRLRELAEERRRLSVRRLHVFLRREGLAVNHQRTGVPRGGPGPRPAAAARGHGKGR